MSVMSVKPRSIQCCSSVYATKGNIPNAGLNTTSRSRQSCPKRRCQSRLITLGPLQRIHSIEHVEIAHLAASERPRLLDDAALGVADALGGFVLRSGVVPP